MIFTESTMLLALYRLLPYREAQPAPPRRDTSHASAVFESFGLLEHILSYSTVPELLTAAFVNERWKEAARSDVIWKPHCRLLWKGKWCMSHVDEDENSELPLFWRSFLSTEEIEELTLDQLRAFYRHPLLELDASDPSLPPQMEQNMIRGALHFYMTSIQNHGLHERWFASYSLSVFDSTRRTALLDSELCSPRGYDTYFKIDPNDVTDEDFLENLVPYNDDEELLLYPHSICYFHEDSRAFTMELREADLRHTPDLKWTRPDEHSVRVGPYPPLVATRQADWGWKLENLHVVLYARFTD